MKDCIALLVPPRTTDRTTVYRMQYPRATNTLALTVTFTASSHMHRVSHFNCQALSFFHLKSGTIDHRQFKCPVCYYHLLSSFDKNTFDNVLKSHKACIASATYHRYCCRQMHVQVLNAFYSKTLVEINANLRFETQMHTSAVTACLTKLLNIQKHLCWNCFFQLSTVLTFSRLLSGLCNVSTSISDQVKVSLCLFVHKNDGIIEPATSEKICPSNEIYKFSYVCINLHVEKKH